MVEFQGYDVKAKKKVTVKNGREVVKGGRRFLVGKSPATGTMVWKIVGVAKKARKGKKK